MGIDREAGVLAREPLLLRGQAELLADAVEQVRGVAAIDDRELRIELQMRRVVAQQAIADRVERAGPLQALRDDLALAAEHVAQGLAHDVHGTAAHLERCAAREGQQQDALRIDAVEREVRHAMRERRRLAGSRAGDDEQRAGAHTLLGQRLAERSRATLSGIQAFEMRAYGRHAANYTQNV